MGHVGALFFITEYVVSFPLFPPSFPSILVAFYLSFYLGILPSRFAAVGLLISLPCIFFSFLEFKPKRFFPSRTDRQDPVYRLPTLHLFPPSVFSSSKLLDTLEAESHTVVKK